MRVQAPFVLHHSAGACVRVEPVDRVIVELPGLTPIVVRRGDIRACVAMLVRVYRERHDATFAGRDDDIVIRLQSEGTSPLVLGPFPHAEGTGIANAIKIGCRDVLFAAPGYSVSVDLASNTLAVASRGPTGGGVDVPIPLDTLCELRVHEDERFDARPSLFGPLPEPYAEQLALEFGRWRDENPVDVISVVVDAVALFANPARWHRRRIEVVAPWRYAFEYSGLGSVWLEAPEHAPVEHGTYRVRAIGTWIYPVANADGGFGHMGAWPGELRAETLEVLDTVEVTRTAPDGLTGLPKRTAFGAALDLASCGQQPVAIAMLDVDRFKRYNDDHGFNEGDELLRRCARAIVETLRPGDVVVRWGGDELAAVLPGTTAETAHELLGRVLARIRPLGITLSAGLAILEAGDTAASVCERADRALYEAKKRGRDCIVVATAAS